MIAGAGPTVSSCHCRLRGVLPGLAGSAGAARLADSVLRAGHPVQRPGLREVPRRPADEPAVAPLAKPGLRSASLQLRPRLGHRPGDRGHAGSYAVLFELMLVLLLAVLLTRTRKEPLLRLGVCLLLPFTVAREGFHLAPFVVLASFACVHLLPVFHCNRDSFAMRRSSSPCSPSASTSSTCQSSATLPTSWRTRCSPRHACSEALAQMTRCCTCRSLPRGTWPTIVARQLLHARPALARRSAPCSRSRSSPTSSRIGSQSSSWIKTQLIWDRIVERIRACGSSHTSWRLTTRLDNGDRLGLASSSATPHNPGVLPSTLPHTSGLPTGPG